MNRYAMILACPVWTISPVSAARGQCQTPVGVVPYPGAVNRTVASVVLFVSPAAGVKSSSPVCPASLPPRIRLKTLPVAEWQLGRPRADKVCVALRIGLGRNATSTMGNVMLIGMPRHKH